MVNSLIKHSQFKKKPIQFERLPGRLPAKFLLRSESLNQSQAPVRNRCRAFYYKLGIIKQNRKNFSHSWAYNQVTREDRQIFYREGSEWLTVFHLACHNSYLPPPPPPPSPPPRLPTLRLKGREKKIGYAAYQINSFLFIFLISVSVIWVSDHTFSQVYFLGIEVA